MAQPDDNELVNNISHKGAKKHRNTSQSSKPANPRTDRTVRVMESHLGEIQPAFDRGPPCPGSGPTHGALVGRKCVPNWSRSWVNNGATGPHPFPLPDRPRSPRIAGDESVASVDECTDAAGDAIGAFVDDHGEPEVVQDRQAPVISALRTKANTSRAVVCASPAESWRFHVAAGMTNE